MKIDRVIFCLDDNPTYAGFWNLNSKVWKTVYDVKPTLIYVGEEEDIEKSNLSKEFGEIFVLPKSPIDLCNNFDRKWYITWALFYGPTLFPNDVCMTSGVDQIPLSRIFMDRIANISKEKYVIGFADAYGEQNWFPSSHHVALGSNYKARYNINENWLDEINKIHQTRTQFIRDAPHKLCAESYWGLDETYSSKVISENKSGVEFINNFFHPLWNPRRIDRGRSRHYDANMLANGWYTEMHAPRPLKNHEEEINKIISIAYGI